MTTDENIHNALGGLNNVRWHDTMFQDLQYYYAEGMVYVLRCKHGEPNEHLCIVLANNPDEAISRAVFDLHKSDEGKKAVNSAALLKAVETIHDRVNSLDEECGVDPVEIRDIARAAIKEPARNCDRLGGDYNKLHAKWFEWTGTPEGQNPDGTAKMVFGEWLLALAPEDRGCRRIEPRKARNEQK